MDVAVYEMRVNFLSNIHLTEERERKMQCKQNLGVLCKEK